MILETAIGILAVGLLIVGLVFVIGVISGIKQGRFYWREVAFLSTGLRVVCLAPVFVLAVLLSNEGWPLSGGIFLLGVGLLFFVKGNGKRKNG
jgi:uncharacterized membrane protein YfcA